MTKRAEINKRKRELCGYMFRGFPLGTVAEKLANRYGVKPTTIKQDWYSRKEWIGEIFNIDLEDDKQFILDVIAEEKEIKKELWKVLNDTDNDNVKIGAIKQLNNINDDLLSMLQSTGFVRKAADELIVSDKRLEDVLLEEGDDELGDLFGEEGEG